MLSETTIIVKLENQYRNEQFPVHRVVLMIWFVCLFSFGHFQIWVTNHSTVHIWPLNHTSNVPQEGKHFSRQQHSCTFPMIDIVIDWAVIYQKKVLHWLPLFSCYSLKQSILKCHHMLLWSMISIFPAVLGGPSAFHLVGDRSHTLACSFHTTPQTSSWWLCLDEQITTGHRRQSEDLWASPAKNLCSVWLVFLRHFVHLAGTHTDRATKYDRIPTQVCSCLREVLSTLTIWPWTSTKLLNSSCIKH